MKKRDAVAALLTANTGQWVGALDLMRVGGALSWRTRLSDCRKELGMTIDWRWRPDPVHGKCSEYRYRAVEHSQ